MKLKRVTNPNAVLAMQWVGFLALVVVALAVGFVVIQPHTMGGEDYDNVLKYTYLVAGLLLPIVWMQVCGWWRQRLLNEKLQAQYDELRETYRHALPTKLSLALFLAMDAVRDETGRENWGVANNPAMVDVRTYSAWLERLVGRNSAEYIIELAREGRAPFVLDHIPADERRAIENLLRESVGTRTM